MRTLLIALTGLLAACAGEPRVTASTADTVTVEYSGDQTSSAELRAGDECNRYGKRARLRNVNTQNTGQRMAIYDCVR